ncbi:NfeD family protein [Salisediminibacterium beveridgei]|uniref:Uncharacterized protein n=1 Tax=Salisediminibacterium beveridgei TaxID=632773 RepID=A0A1D7QUC3_9BACI|nr:nodulation protein NfeD [Salisediminibacterium beveridgei]AOM82585.1 hypothetical protein BBEV_1217 [Salisediminibacterium beveridgei]
MKRLRLAIYMLLIISGMTMLFLPADQASGSGDGEIVYIVPVEKEVERGLQAFLERSIQTAEEEGASHIIFEVNTPGGFVDAAGGIATLIRNAEPDTTAFVVERALSAGAYISLNADEIVMAPGSSMGSASVIDGSGSAADDKAQSAWLANMREAAELNDRDPIYALAMADREIEIPELDITDENILTLTPSQALEVGYAEEVLSTREEVLEYIGYENAEIREMEVTLSEQIARFVTNPIVVPILLSIGSLGLVLELYSPGFGIPGIMGASALLLFFFGHLVAGFAGLETVILLGIGIVLLLIEVFSPSFGILGFLGIGAIMGSLVLSSYDTSMMLMSLLIAIVVTIVASVMFFKYVGYNGPLKRVVLLDQAGNDQGYISSESKNEHLGRTGTALTILRPSGVAEINDERLDVVSEGGYIEQGRKVKVISVSGSRIVVRELKSDEAE